jgi:lysophospholipase L1-like esterase
VVLGLALGVVLAEAVARFGLGLGTLPLSVPHPTIEYMFKPDQDVSRFGHRVRINQFGMRSDPIEAKRPDELRVLVFGDSVVNGGSLTDQAALATTILQQQLAHRTQRPVYVGNVSAGSWGPGNWLAYAREFGFFSSDVVVLVISSHDATDVPTFEPLDPATHPTQTPVLALQELFQRYLPQQLAARGWLGRTTDAASPRPSDEARLQAQALADLKSFLRLAQASGAQVVVLQYPERAEVTRGVDLPGHAAIREACESVGVVPIELRPRLAARLRRGENPYRDEIHPNEVGQQTIAATLEPLLAGQR